MPAQTSHGLSVVWFRSDLRLQDNPALTAAVERAKAEGQGVLGLYCLDPQVPRPLGAARLWWLHHSLTGLEKALEGLGIPLILRRGPASDVVPAVIEESGAGAVFWNRIYEGAAVERDTALKAALKDKDIEAESFNGALLREPWEVASGSGQPYKVFTAYWRAARATGEVPPPLPAPKPVKAASKTVTSETLNDWDLLPRTPDWSGGLQETWTPGETGAHKQLERFLEDALSDYADARDRPAVRGTSMLSPHLAFGEISPRSIWHAVTQRVAKAPARAKQADKFLAEVGWREFSYQLLFHNPDLPTTSLRPEFRRFPWRRDEAALTAWQRGVTGYPIVDAGMRQLWHTGWMHNRVRMIVGSLLVKHLLIAWQDGEAWFWDTLVDADPANNTAGWQWIAGCGADAAPYFRVFNPVLQGEKFDPEGAYVARWVPELAKLPRKHIHKPWDAPQKILEEAGVTLGQDYPRPIVDLKLGRERALEAFQSIKADAAA